MSSTEPFLVTPEILRRMRRSETRATIGLQLSAAIRYPDEQTIKSIATTSSPVSYANQVVVDGPVVYWRMGTPVVRGEYQDEVAFSQPSVYWRMNDRHLVAILDSFNRADTTGLGVTDTGETWEASTSQWSIQSNYATGTDTVTAWYNALVPGTVDGAVAVTLNIAGTLPGLVGRAVDASTYYALLINATSLNIYRFPEAAALAAASHSFAAGSQAKFECIGSTLNGYVNDVLVISVVDTVLTGTKWGLFNYSTDSGNVHFDDFSFTEVVS